MKAYLVQLKKAVHPAGFAAFGKVSIATAISAAIGTTGSSLGGGYTADTDTFSPILASTFEVLFAEVNQSRHQATEIAIGDLESHIWLETMFSRRKPEKNLRNIGQKPDN